MMLPPSSVARRKNINRHTLDHPLFSPYLLFQMRFFLAVLLFPVLATAMPKSKGRSNADHSIVEGIYKDHHKSTAAQSRSSNAFSTGQNSRPTGTFQNSYSRPLAIPTTTNSYSTPSKPMSQVKVLPLPIPVGLPVPVPHPYQSPYHHYDPYTYGKAGILGGSYPLYGNGLFGGFGSKLLSPLLKEIALGGPKGLASTSEFPSAAATALGFHGGIFGSDPIKASLVASKSNPLIHLLAAPYIKNIKESNGEDLPTLDDFQRLLQRATFPLTDIDENGI